MVFLSIKNSLKFVEAVDIIIKGLDIECIYLSLPLLI